MNKGIYKKSWRLSKRVFLYLSGISLFSLLIVGSLWIGDKIGLYTKEINILKQTYANTKKEDIKIKVLQVKDYLYWVKNNPLSALSNEMDKQIKDLAHLHFLNDITLGKRFNDETDTCLVSMLSFCVINKSGKVIYSHKSDGVSTRDLLSAMSEYEVFNKKNDSQGNGVIPQYLHSGPQDSVLNKVIYYNTEVLQDHCILAHIGQKELDRLLQRHILDSLSTIRYLKDEYFFVNTIQGEALISNGKVNTPPLNILESKDTAWIRIFNVQKSSRLVAIGLFHTYMWPKISGSKIIEKTSFFSFFPEWGWIVGTGFYADDVNGLIKIKRLELLGELRKSVFKGTLLFCLSVLLSYGIVISISRRFKENLELFTVFFNKAAHEGEYINTDLVHYTEFTNLALLANNMIVEQTTTKKALHRSEEKFNKAFKNSPDALIITTFDSGVIIDANIATTRITGYSFDEIVGRSTPELNFWNNPEDRIRFFHLLNQNNRVENFESALRMKSGEIRQGLFSAEVIIIGEDKCVLSVIRDVTERKLMEASLKNREHILSLIYSHVQDAIFLLGIEEDSNYRFLSVNQAFLELTGIKEEQVVQKLVSEIIPEPSLTMVLKNYKHAIENKISVQWEETSQYPSGAKSGMVTITPLCDAHGNCLNLVGTVHDITERKKAEEEIHQLNLNLEQRIAERTNQLSLINKELESFSYSISHDLRAPLRAIYGFSQILVRRHRSSLDEEGQQYMDYIVEASKRMEQLINDLLNYSRLGRKSIHIHPVSLKHVVENIYTDFKQRLEHIGATFIVVSDLPDLPGDESLLQQILSNLVDNAIKYRRNDIPLKIEIFCDKKADSFHISLTDNGIGISKEYWGKIFNIFQRLHSEEQYPGTGIGLAAVKKAANHLNGSVEVRSEVGKGSTFTVILPVINKQNYE